jgi:hypothetical protein
VNGPQKATPPVREDPRVGIDAGAARQVAPAASDAGAAQQARERRYIRALEGALVSGMRAGARRRRRRRASGGEPAQG